MKNSVVETVTAVCKRTLCVCTIWEGHIWKLHRGAKEFYFEMQGHFKSDYVTIQKGNAFAVDDPHAYQRE